MTTHRIVTLILLCLPMLAHPQTHALLPPLQTYLQARAGEQDQIAQQRKYDLDRLAAYIRSQREAGKAVHLLFVCTHNSRRSHMAQAWAQAAATYVGLDHVTTYNAGTEATAFNPRAVAARQRAGFHVGQTPPPAPAVRATN